MALVFPLMLVHERLADSLFITFNIWVYDQQIKLEPLGLVHLLFFASILGIQVIEKNNDYHNVTLIPLFVVSISFSSSPAQVMSSSFQFVSMLWHRWGTFLHILAFTEFKKKQEKFAVEQVVDAVKELQQIKVLHRERNRHHLRLSIMSL